MIPLTLLTTIGHVTVPRRYLACPECKDKRIPWDDWAGVDNRHMSQGACRMLSLAGMSWPFYTDGVKINTVDGWREMRLSVLAKRPAALPATPRQWKDRVLEEPTARMGVCAIAPANVVGSSWKRLAKRLGLAPRDPLSVIADGARWIWIEAAKRFGPDTQWMVDVFHVSEHLHGCGKAMLGEGPPARQWAEAQLERLIKMEGPRYIEELDRQIDAAQEAASRQALEKLRGVSERESGQSVVRDATGRGSADWQRPDRGSVQEHDRGAAKDQLRSVEGSSR